MIMRLHTGCLEFQKVLLMLKQQEGGFLSF